MEIFADYRDKSVVVTGCYSGIGREVARLLIDLGARVHGLDIRANDLGFQDFTAFDLRDPASIEAAARSIEEPVDALFNCAGIPPGAAPLDVLAVNYVGTRYLTDLILPKMPEGGAIANVASVGGAGWARHVPQLLELVDIGSFGNAMDWCRSHEEALAAAYSFSKEAIIMWTMAEAARLAPRRIRMNCTSPGAVQTPMLEKIEETTPAATINITAQPIGRRSAPEEQAWPLLFLNSSAASYVSGAVLPVDGGFMGARLSRQLDVGDIGRK